jgi:hypothetical protein
MCTFMCRGRKLFLFSRKKNATRHLVLFPAFVSGGRVVALFVSFRGGRVSTPPPSPSASIAVTTPAAPGLRDVHTDDVDLIISQIATYMDDRVNPKQASSCQRIPLNW